jgi:Zn-dependent protease
VLAWKLKAIGAFLAGSGKFLILGAAKGGALLPALVSLAAFGTGFGWRIAGGLMASLYVHELGHVAWSRRYGIPVTPPMFVPGLGAFVRLRHRPVDAHEDARIGLAGPAWGLAAAVTALVLAFVLRSPAARGVAWWGALINLLNLIPYGPLDGGRAFRPLSRIQRTGIASALFFAWLVGGGWPCALLAALSALRGADATAPAQGDRLVITHFLVIAGLLIIVVAVSARGAPFGPT